MSKTHYQIAITSAQETGKPADSVHPIPADTVTALRLNASDTNSDFVKDSLKISISSQGAFTGSLLDETSVTNQVIILNNLILAADPTLGSLNGTNLIWQTTAGALF